MSNFGGKNGLTVKEAFYERLKYSSQAFPRDYSRRLVMPNGIRDFNFAERNLYGRINKRHQAITLNTFFLKDLKSRRDPRRQMRAVNFVVDAFEGLVRDMQKAAVAGKIDDADRYLYRLAAHRSYINPRDRYQQYTQSLTDIFLNTFLNKQRSPKVISFETFLPVFEEFLTLMSEANPVTFTSFVTSRYCNSLVSGLTVFVADLDASDDSDKEAFINSRNFPFFQNAASKHGFVINKDVPWALTADIASEGMLRYSSRYGLASEDQILGAYYQRPYTGDVESIQRMAFTIYNSFVGRSPNSVVVDDSGMRRYTCRYPISLDSFNEKYPDKKWIDLYSEIRYNEHKKPLSKAKLQQIKVEAKSVMEATASTTDALDHINFNIFGFDKYNGTLAKLTEKYSAQSEANQATRGTTTIGY